MFDAMVHALGCAIFAVGLMTIIGLCMVGAEIVWKSIRGYIRANF